MQCTRCLGDDSLLLPPAAAVTPLAQGPEGLRLVLKVPGTHLQWELLHRRGWGTDSLMRGRKVYLLGVFCTRALENSTPPPPLV